MASLRADRRNFDIRPLTIELGVNRYAEGSALIRSGNTHVLCTVTIENKVPDWLAGKGKGWLTSEYSMLPRSTHTRNKRERERVSGRTQEIQRLIGRALRSTIHLAALGERTLTLDCDVLQADGGTRTAAINGGFVAAVMALKKLGLQQSIKSPLWSGTVSAISVGLKAGEPLVDLNYEEDSSCDVDMNVVMKNGAQYIEIQGTAEQDPFDDAELQKLLSGAKKAILEIGEIQQACLAKL